MLDNVLCGNDLHVIICLSLQEVEAMEGSTDHYSLHLRVEQGFECSRLEKELLASAYERLIPILRCRLSDPRIASPTELRRHGMGREQHIAKGV
jgi:hypothetical protein